MSRFNHALVVIALFLGSLAVSTVAFPRLAIRPGGYPRSLSMPAFEAPTRSDHFFVHALGYELSQLVLYHGLGDSIANARRADILFLGNSRLQLGFDAGVLTEEAASQGLRVFSLGSGHRERANFGLDVIRRHDLRPKIVVVSGGPFLFDDRYSLIAEEAMAMTRFRAAKKWLEVAGSWNLQYRLHDLVPKLDYFDHELLVGWIHYRSSRDGWWHPALVPDTRRDDIAEVADEDLEPGMLRRIAQFEAELASRDSLLFLTVTPWDETRLRHIELAERSLGIPNAIPGFEGLTTVDGSHLSPESARIYSRRFWELFIAHPAVWERLALAVE